MTMKLKAYLQFHRSQSINTQIQISWFQLTATFVWIGEISAYMKFQEIYGVLCCTDKSMMV